MKISPDLERAAEMLMKEIPDANIAWFNHGKNIAGRIGGYERTRFIPIEITPRWREEWPETGITPFGWWLYRVWTTRIPRIVVWPGMVDLCWMGLRDTLLWNDLYVRKVI